MSYIRARFRRRRDARARHRRRDDRRFRARRSFRSDGYNRYRTFCDGGGVRLFVQTRQAVSYSALHKSRRTRRFRRVDNNLDLHVTGNIKDRNK